MSEFRDTLGRETDEGYLTLRLGRIVREKYPPKKRAARTVKLIEAEVRRRMRLDDEYVIRIDPELNELIWSRGAGNPPRVLRIYVRVDREEKVANVGPSR